MQEHVVSVPSEAFIWVCLQMLAGGGVASALLLVDLVSALRRCDSFRLKACLELLCEALVNLHRHQASLKAELALSSALP